MYRMLEYRIKRYLKYQNIHILLFLLRRFSQSLASQYGKPFLLKGNFILTVISRFHVIVIHYLTCNNLLLLLILISRLTIKMKRKLGFCRMASLCLYCVYGMVLIILFAFKKTRGR